MKRILSLILSLTVFVSAFGGLNLSARANNLEAEEEYIYYSDLFYGYSHYLTNSFLTTRKADSSGVAANIIEEYTTTPWFTASVISHSIDIATDPTSMAKYVSDNIGLSNFQFNDELDKANQKFAMAVCDVNLDASKELGTNNKYIKSINSFLKMAKDLESLSAENEAYYKGLEKPELYKTFLDQSIAYLEDYCTELAPKLPSLGSQIYTTLCETTAVLGTLSDALEFSQALALSVMMQETQIQLIDEIIDTQDSSSTLYKGMTRLKKQLNDGFVSYFANTYIEDKVYDEVIGYLPTKASKWILGNWATFGSNVTSVVKILNTAVFDWILDVHYFEYTSAIMLVEYANDLYDSVRTKADVFSAPFSSTQIEKYEVLFNAYISMQAAAFEELKNLAEHNTTYGGDSYINSVSHCFDIENAYTDYIDSVKDFISTIPLESRIITDFGTWSLSNNFTLSGGSDEIKANYLYFPRSGLKANIRKSHDDKFCSLRILDGQYIKLLGNFDVHFNDKYSVEDATLTISEDTVFEVDGDFSFTCSSFSGSSGTKAYIINHGELNVSGNLTLNGFYSYFWGGSQSTVVTNYGTINVLGNLTLDNAVGPFTNYSEVNVSGDLGVYNLGTIRNNSTITCHGLILYSYYEEPTPYQYSQLLMSNSATTYVSGNVEIHDAVIANNGDPSCLGGTLVLNGVETQEIYGLYAKNIEVTNPAGIKYLSNINVYGEYKLNGNPLDNNGYTANCYTGSSFGDDSDYKSVYIPYQNTITLDKSIGGDFSGGEQGGIIIPANAKVVIDGSVTLRWGKLTNNGELTVTDTINMRGKDSGITNNGILHALSNIVFEKDTNNRYGYLVMSNDSSIMSIGGDVSLPDVSCGKISKGKVIFNGSSKQTITKLTTIPTVILENESPEGVVFSSALNSSVLFDHKGNNFTLYNNGSGSKFVDYDSDGLNDNVDPKPTVSRYFTLTFEAVRGTVSTDSLVVEEGQEITVLATPIGDLAFDKWIDSSGKTVSTEPEYTFIATEEETYTAIFTIDNTTGCSHVISDDIIMATQPTEDTQGLLYYPCIYCNRMIEPICEYSANLDTGECSIDNYVGKLTTVTIPEYINGLPVTSINYAAFYDCEIIQSVSLPKSLRKIRDSAFGNCSNLANISIPAGVTQLGWGAFSNCVNLKSVKIPSKLKYLSETFSFCSNLETVELNDELESIDALAFQECISLKEIVIPDSVTYIGWAAFYGCKNLESVKLPNNPNFTELWTGVLDGCSKLESVVIPNSVETIYDACFRDCSSLKSITIPSSVTLIESEAFAGCTNLKTINYYGSEEDWENISKISACIPSDVNLVFNYTYKTSYHIDFCDKAGNLVYTLKIFEGETLNAVKLAEIEALLPEIFGYNFTGWNSDITEPIYADTVFKAIYSRKTDKDFSLNVSHKGEDKAAAHSFDEFVTVTADSENFLCWKDAKSGVVVSIEPEYSFYIPGDISLIAVYKESDDDKAELPFVYINSTVNTVVGSESYNAIFTASVNLPEGATLLEKGMIFTNDTGYALGEEAFKLGLDPSMTKASALLATGNFMITLTEIPMGENRYARAYVIYELDGVQHTEYSQHIASVTKSIVSIDENVEIVANDSTYDATVSAATSLPESATLIEKGVLFTTSTGYNKGEENFIIGSTVNTAIIKAVSEDTSASGVYTGTYAGIRTGVKRYARAYVIYELDGVQYTKYSNIVVLSDVE